jgi:hypothetical protein
MSFSSTRQRRAEGASGQPRKAALLAFAPRLRDSFSRGLNLAGLRTRSSRTRTFDMEGRHGPQEHRSGDEA